MRVKVAQLYIELTTRCRMHCQHCAQNCTEEGEDMSMETFVKAIAIAKNIGANVTLGGGEPTEHDWFRSFAIYAMNTLGIGMVELVTNGMNKDICMELADWAETGLLRVQLSLDKYHDPIDAETVQRFKSLNVTYYPIRELYSVSAKGRGKNIEGASKGGCGAPEVYVGVNGIMWECQCKAVQLGTVDSYESPVCKGYDTATEVCRGYCSNEGQLRISKEDMNKYSEQMEQWLHDKGTIIKFPRY